MKKTNFVKLINAVRAQNERERKFCDALMPFFDNYLAFEISTDFQDSILHVLEDEMNDPCKESQYGSLISWWLYDAPDAGKEKDSAYIELPDGYKYTLETPEQLYDYLVMQNELAITP